MGKTSVENQIIAKMNDWEAIAVPSNTSEKKAYIGLRENLLIPVETMVSGSVLPKEILAVK